MARDYRIDSLKGLLIILVITGHVITTLDNVNFINHGVMGLIYIFHMPLFILISGYFSKSREEQTPSAFWKSTALLFVTLVIFHLIGCFRSYLSNPNARAIFDGFPFGEKMWIIFPFGELWYIISLIYWRIILYYTPKALLKRPAIYLSIALIVSILCGLTHLGMFLSIQRTMNFFLFFLLGYYFKHGCISPKLWYNSKLQAIVALVLLPIIFILFPRCGNFMNGADHYSLIDIPEKVMILTCSISISLFIFNNMKDVKWLRPFGQDSLFYYLYHYLIIVLVIQPLVIRYELPCTFPFIVCYTAFILIVLRLFSNVKFLRWLTHPKLPVKIKS